MSIQQDGKEPLEDRLICVVILAAGLGRRMGQHPKLLLPLSDGKPIIWHTVRTALDLAIGPVIAVTRPNLLAVEEALSDLPIKCVLNPLYMEGMATSLAVGIQALPGNAEAALVMLGDEPHFDPHIARELLSAYRREQKPITMPRYGNQSGPPTLFGNKAFAELLRLHGDRGGRQLAEQHPEWLCMVPFDEAMRPRDIDTEEDYRTFL